MIPDARKLASYHEQGYIRFEDFLPEEALQKIEVEIDRVSRLDPSSFQEAHLFFAEGTDTIQQIEHLHAYSKFFRDLMERDRRVLDPVEAIFEAKAVCDNVSYMAKPPRIGAVVPYHQDNAYHFFVPDHALSVWIALDDSTEENGCLRVVPGSHKQGIVEHGPTGVLGISYGVKQPIDPAQETPILLKRGDASLHHCGVFHTSHPNRSDRSRRSLILFCHSVNCRVDEQGRAAYQANLQSAIEAAKSGDR